MKCTNVRNQELVKEELEWWEEGLGFRGMSFYSSDFSKSLGLFSCKVSSNFFHELGFRVKFSVKINIQERLNMGGIRP